MSQIHTPESIRADFQNAAASIYGCNTIIFDNPKCSSLSFEICERRMTQRDIYFRHESKIKNNCKLMKQLYEKYKNADCIKSITYQDIDFSELKQKYSEYEQYICNDLVIDF